MLQLIIIRVNKFIYQSYQIPFSIRNVLSTAFVCNRLFHFIKTQTNTKQALPLTKRKHFFSLTFHIIRNGTFLVRTINKYFRFTKICLLSILRRGFIFIPTAYNIMTTNSKSFSRTLGLLNQFLFHIIITVLENCNRFKKIWQIFSHKFRKP